MSSCKFSQPVIAGQPIKLELQPCQSFFVTARNDFKPTDIDLFYIREESTKKPRIENCKIGTVKYQVIDVGTLPSERYVISALSDVHYVIFAVALSGYCRCLLNSNGVVSNSH